MPIQSEECAVAMPPVPAMVFKDWRQTGQTISSPWGTAICADIEYTLGDVASGAVCLEDGRTCRKRLCVPDLYALAAKRAANGNHKLVQLLEEVERETGAIAVEAGLFEADAPERIEVT